MESQRSIFEDRSNTDAVKFDQGDSINFHTVISEDKVALKFSIEYLLHGLSTLGHY